MPKASKPSAVFWDVYKWTPEGLELAHGSGRIREEAVQVELAKWAWCRPFSMFAIFAA